MSFVTVFTLAAFISSVNAYFPNSLSFCFVQKTLCSDPSVNGPTDHTHSSMTKQSIANVTEKLASSAGISLGEWQAARQDALHHILDGSREIGRLRDKESTYHFNAERFVEAEDLLISWRRQILKLASQPGLSENLKPIRHLIGQSLHLIQDFYSNTDWVNYHNRSYDQLGVENKSDPLVFRKMGFPCKLKEGTLAKNGYWITSSYRADQDKPLPNGTVSGRKVSKCPHGGRYDNSERQGGINTESFDGNMSPTYCWLHTLSSEMAINASKAFLVSGAGLSSVLPVEDLLTILGVRVPPHVSLLLTSTLRELSKSIDWKDVWQLAKQQWPWQVNHLFSGDGSKSTENTTIYQELSAQRHAQIITLTPDAVLRAISVLPDHSHLVVVTGAEKESLPSVNEVKLIENLLKNRNIRLLWFMEKTISLEVPRETTVGIQRMCSTTKGMMVFFSNAAGLLEALVAMKPHTAQIEFVPKETISLLVPANSTSYLLVNCREKQSNWPALTTDSGVMSEAELVSTDYLTITKVTPEGAEHVTVTVRPKRSCVVSMWTRESSMIEVYSVTKGARDQWYPKPLQARGEGRVVIESASTFPHSLSLQSIESSGYNLTFRSCPHDTLGSELVQTQLTDVVSDIQESELNISLKYHNTNISVQTYIDTQRVEINAILLLPADTTSINISVVNRKLDDMHFFILEDEDVDISPRNFSPSFYSNSCSVIITLEPCYLSTSQQRFLTFVVESVDLQTKKKFTDTHTFQVVLLDRQTSNFSHNGAKYQRCTPTINTTSTTTTKSTTTSTAVSSSTISASTSVTQGEITLNRESTDQPTLNTVQMFVLSMMATILIVTTPIVIIAGALYLHFRCKQGNPPQVTEL